MKISSKLSLALWYALVNSVVAMENQKLEEGYQQYKQWQSLQQKQDLAGELRFSIEEVERNRSLDTKEKAQDIFNQYKNQYKMCAEFVDPVIQRINNENLTLLNALKALQEKLDPQSVQNPALNQQIQMDDNTNNSQIIQGYTKQLTEKERIEEEIKLLIGMTSITTDSSEAQELQQQMISRIYEMPAKFPAYSGLINMIIKKAGSEGWSLVNVVNAISDSVEQTSEEELIKLAQQLSINDDDQTQNPVVDDGLQIKKELQSIADSFIKQQDADTARVDAIGSLYQLAKKYPKYHDIIEDAVNANLDNFSALTITELAKLFE